MLAVIGGSGLCELLGAEVFKEHDMTTVYGKPSASITEHRLDDVPFCFLPRHGNPHNLLPHEINYKANINALKLLKVTQIIAVNAVGGISNCMGTGHLVVPDQIIDYSYGRGHTFYGDGRGVEHIDFSQPFSASIRESLTSALFEQQLDYHSHGVYACTQGPRLETAAEIQRLERDGCDIVGMTGMPEAALAREVGIEYASLALVVNPAAGKVNREISMDEIRQVLEFGMKNVKSVLARAITDLAAKG